MKQILVILFLLATDLFAHGALEFIDLQTYEIGNAGSTQLYFQYDYISDDSNDPKSDHWEFTPGVSYSIINKLQIDIHTHFAKFESNHLVAPYRTDYEHTGSSPFMEAVAAVVQYQITSELPVNFAIALMTEVPFKRAKQLLGSDKNLYGAMLIAGYDFGKHSNLTFNLVYENEGEDDTTTWGLGCKTPLGQDDHGVNAGLEIISDFDFDTWSILPGIYIPISEGIMAKSGIAFGQEEAAQTLRASVSFMYSF